MGIQMQIVKICPPKLARFCSQTSISDAVAASMTRWTSELGRINNSLLGELGVALLLLLVAIGMRGSWLLVGHGWSTELGRINNSLLGELGVALLLLLVAIGMRGSWLLVGHGWRILRGMNSPKESKASNRRPTKMIVAGTTNKLMGIISCNDCSNYFN
uniref:Uncharacterized protein n=1 Tax=Pristionchus pacificus TaxID=54126 RepID=A0A2A6CMF2_PRIPA|eukprot:PDM79425.1 hypothetical protein PRIPAC_32004 [Pristionchus pacificus]